MKSYTDLEQSKELAEILPIESADMYYTPYPNDEYWYDIPNFGKADLKFNQLPCWSLTALLDVIPYCSLRRFVDGNWIVSAEFSLNGYRESQPNKSAVDACVEMIITLQEQKLL